MTAAGRRAITAASAAVCTALVSLVSSSCGVALMKLPAGPRMPATDGAAVIEQATAACRDISTSTLEIAVRGSVGGQRIRARLSAGLARPASARLEAVASFGQPAFFFVATNANATIYMPRDRRVARGRPQELLAAVAGVPLDAQALRSVVTGCASMPNVAAMQALGSDWRVASDGGDEIYLHREQAAAPWRVRVIIRPGSGGWRADYSKFDRGLPHAIHLVSTPDGRPALGGVEGVDLQLDLSQVEINVPLGADVFQIQIPPAAETISVDELRRSGPLGGK
jgi:outer membrane lipoprotein-sorting protein